MQVHTYLAASVQDAVAQIRDTLGPEAVVLNVRRLPGEGLARLWQKPRIEVLAHVPEKTVLPQPAATLDEVQVSALAELRAEMQQLRDSFPKPAQPAVSHPEPVQNFIAPAPPILPSISEEVPSLAACPTTPREGEWQVGAFLETTGLLPVYATRVVEALRATHGEEAPAIFADELQLARQMLAQFWKPTKPTTTGPHVFIGTPGVGKTTALCKWLAQATLVEGRTTAVWRLDGHVANTAESLSVFAEILGVSVERFAPTNGERPDADVLFVDLPGVNPADAPALAQLQQRLASLPDAQVHLVLNGAYESSLLLAQLRAFSGLRITDVIVTHLDEESRWGKLWNLVLGTNCTIRFLGAGQNVPGDFLPAEAETIFRRQFPQKSAVFASPA